MRTAWFMSLVSVASAVSAVSAVSIGPLGCGPATTEVPIQIVPALPSAPAPLTVAPPPSAPRTNADRENDFASAWATWASGGRAEATAAFRKLVRELVDLPTKSTSTDREPGLPSAPLAASADGSRAVAIVGDGAYYFDGAGVPLRYDVAEASSVAFLAHTNLAILSGTSLAIVDASTLTRVVRAADVTGYGASGKTVLYQSTGSSDVKRLHVWDATTRTERRIITLAAGESFDAATVHVSPDEKEISCRLFADDGTLKLAVFDEAGARMDLPGHFEAAAPSYSGDGKYFAYAYPAVGDKGFAGKTVLYDRSTRKVVAQTGSSSYPTATRFTKSGKMLVVGDLRRLSIMEVPSLRVLATTPFLRERGGMDDDLQNVVDIDILGADVGFWAMTADSTNGVFRLPSGSVVWKGRGSRSIDAGGTQRFDDRGEKNVLVTIDPKLMVAQRPLTQTEIDAPYPSLDDAATQKMRATLDKTVCIVRERLFPIDACK